MVKLVGQSEAGPKHISQLNPTRRAIADQSIREALLAIVVAQGKPVSIPIEDLNRISAQNRLLIEVGDGVVTLTAERATLVATPEGPKIIQ